MIRSKNAGSQGNFFLTRDMESPLTLTLSPLDKGGEGREWGDLPAKTHPLVRRMSVAGVPLSEPHGGYKYGP